MDMKSEYLENYQQGWALKPDEWPAPCKKCKFRTALYWLSNVKFCNYSSYTCNDRINPCDEFKEIDRQLTFDF